MARTVYDHRTRRPAFYIDGEFACGYADHQPKFFIADRYWYRMPASSDCVYWMPDGRLYACPSGTEALFHAGA
jgi:hypothetical protein